MESYNGAWRETPADWSERVREGDTILYNPPHVPGRGGELEFRVVLTGAGQRHDSPPVGLFAFLSPGEFRTVRAILTHEMTDMRAGNGHRVRVAKPLEYGEPADSYDQDTGQMLNPGGDLSGYGERYRGGFAAPVSTWARFQQTQESRTSTTGQGEHDRKFVQARLFSYPPAKPGDLLIDGETGLRYTVQNRTPHLFRGIFPVMEDVLLEELPRSHIRYRWDPDA
jgi:hypothetical protein